MALTCYQKKIAKRQNLLESIFSGLQDHLGSDFAHIELNSIVLHNVVVSYFDDVDRHKDYHVTTRVDEVKQAAYTIKWIAKLRPIQFSCPEDVVSKPLLYVNEVFAMRGGMAFLRISPDVLPELLYDDMLYTLRYRHIDERMLIVWLSTLQHALDGDIPHTDIQV